MSAFGMLAYPDGTVVVASDSLSSTREPITLDGKEYPERIFAHGAKSIYYSHLKAVVSGMGSGMMASEYHRFIESRRAISNMDHLIHATELYFKEWLDNVPRIAGEIPDDDNPNFLGTIMLAGLSHSQIDIESNIALPRKQPAIRVFKFMVYKDRITKAEIDMSPDGLTHMFHPPLPSGTVDGIFARHEDNHPDIYSLSNDVLVDMMKVAHEQYMSERKTMVTGGEVTIHVLSGRHPYGVTTYVAHRFDDFDDIIQEVVYGSKEAIEHENIN